MINVKTYLYDGIEVRAQKTLDARTIVTYREDLYKINTWPHDTYVDEQGKEHHTIYMQEGMIVVVTGDKDNPVFEAYILSDLSKILEKDYSGWTFLGSMTGGGGLGVAGNIDGGHAAGRYSPNQVINGGSAITRGETDDE